MTVPAATMPQPGARIDDRYRVVRVLGEGGMALVYEVIDERTQQRLALKMLVPDLARDPEIVARFEREGRASASLRSEHVVRMMALEDRPGGHPYMVMELLEGRDLEHELESRVRIPVQEAVDYVLQACAALSEAHAAGIIHRDLKPANLFLLTKPTPLVKVLDFGISKVLGAPTKLTRVGAVIGTVVYMSPEQVRGEADLDPRADIWSLGVILYELVEGQPPFLGKAQQIALKIVTEDPAPMTQAPPALDVIVRAMLARDRNKRPVSVEEVARAIAPFSQRGLGLAFADSIATESVRLRRRETMKMDTAPQTLLTRPEPPPRASSVIPWVIGIVIAMMGISGSVLIVLWFFRQPAPKQVPSVPSALPSTSASSSILLPNPPATTETGTTPTSSTKKDRDRPKPAPSASASASPAPSASENPRLL